MQEPWGGLNAPGRLVRMGEIVVPRHPRRRAQRARRWRAGGRHSCGNDGGGAEYRWERAKGNFDGGSSLPKDLLNAHC